VALWRHFPVDDTTAQGLSQAVAGFQAEYDFDLVKVTHASGYPAEAWGAELIDGANEEGTREYLRRPIGDSSAWRTLEPLPIDNQVLKRELRALELVRERVGSDVHVLATIFNPLTAAKQLAGEPRMLEDLRAAPEALASGLQTIAESMARFAREALDHGADGIFFATQFARRDKLTDDEYARFGLPFDMQVLDAVRRRSLILLHLHGRDPMFELCREFDADIVNWHDRETSPTLGEGLARLDRGAVLGGVCRADPLGYGSPMEVAEQVRDSVEQTAGRRLILGAGCVTLVSTPAENIEALTRAAMA
jgi:uroporphyrinogen decarboxylase